MSSQVLECSLIVGIEIGLRVLIPVKVRRTLMRPPQVHIPPAQIDTLPITRTYTPSPSYSPFHVDPWQSMESTWKEESRDRSEEVWWAWE
eukprot:gene21368-biopygen7320